jgi:AraC-like DNA-binding protein
LSHVNAGSWNTASIMGSTDSDRNSAEDALLPRDPVPYEVLRFSTDDFSEHRRIEAYREIYGRTIIKHEIKPIGDRPFHFDASLCNLPGLGLAVWRISPCLRSHGLQHNDSDHLVLGVGRSGGCVVQQRGREAMVGKGEAVLTSSADPAVVAITSMSEAVSLRIPRSVLRSRIGDLDARVSRPIPRGTEGLSLLTGYVGAIRGAEALTDPQMCELVVAHVYDLVALVLGAKGDARKLAQDGGGRAARRSAIFSAIESRSGIPDLSAAAVAALLGVTPRYIHLLLEETGRSFTHHLLERRLENAARLLRDPRWYPRRIGDIALEAGFTDLSHFSRAFRRRYGVTPSDVREAAMRDATQRG